MSLKMHDIKIADVKSETPHAKVVSFDIPYEQRELFRFTPGQYLTIETVIDGHKVRRAYSICSKRGDTLAIGVKRVDGGLMSNFLNDKVKAGDTVRLMPPMGNFTHDPQPFKQKHYVLFAGGSGITPMMSILKSTLPIEKDSKVTLLYFNRNEEHIMFRSELAELEQTYPNLKVVHNIDEPLAAWDGYKGRFSEARAKELLDAFVFPDSINVHYFMCGPSGLMLIVDNFLKSNGINIERIHKEYFTAPLDAEPGKAHGKETLEVSDSPVDAAELTFMLDGEEHQVSYKGEDSILEAALDNDVDAPYACQIGACCTCRAKLTEGEVVMADRESLSDAEIEDGYILTCQAKPLTKKLVYSYDS